LINPGAFIGALIGFFFGIRFGLVIGILGSMLGSSLGSRIGSLLSHQSSGGWFSGWGSAGSAGPVFMDNLFSMLGRLAAADGYVSPQEEQLFQSVVVNELRITDPASVASALDIFRKAASGNTPMGVYARQAAEAFRNRPQLLEMMLIIMVRVSASTGSLHPEEDRLLRETAATFGFSSGAYESLKMRYGAGTGGRSGSSGYGSPGSSAGASSLKSAYATLGIPENASESEIRKAYRRKASEYHPDKIAAKGLPKDFTELANKKFQEIQEAWDSIRKARGF